MYFLNLGVKGSRKVLDYWHDFVVVFCFLRFSSSRAFYNFSKLLMRSISRPTTGSSGKDEKWPDP